jgi:hypothetical protein
MDFCIADDRGTAVPISGRATMLVCPNAQLAQVPWSLQIPAFKPTATGLFDSPFPCCIAIFYVIP